MKHRVTEELGPQIMSVHYLMLVKMLRVFKAQINEKFQENDKLDILDVGCGAKPYKKLFMPFSKSYIGVDPYSGADVEIHAPAEDLPIDDQSFDIILCTQVLEHVKDYKKAISEMHRVLKPNGIIFLSTHGTYPIHGAPNDYWRFTRYGLEEIFHNFYDVEIIPIGGIIVYN